MDASDGLRVLFVTNDPEERARMRALEIPGITVDCETDTNPALMRLEPGRYTAVIADAALNGSPGGAQFLLAAHQIDPHATTVLLTDEADPPADRVDEVLPRRTSPQKLLARILILRDEEMLRAA